MAVAVYSLLRVADGNGALPEISPSLPQHHPPPPHTATRSFKSLAHVNKGRRSQNGQHDDTTHRPIRVSQHQTIRAGFSAPAISLSSPVFGALLVVMADLEGES